MKKRKGKTAETQRPEGQNKNRPGAEREGRDKMNGKKKVSKKERERDTLEIGS